jgi:polyhydroxybutyrate depolymerase
MATATTMSLRTAWAAAWSVGLCLSVSVSGCGDSVIERTFMTPLTKRNYRVYSPQSAKGDAPEAILFVLHGYGEAPMALVNAFLLKKRAVKAARWVMVVPEGTFDDRGKRFWNASEACCGDIARRPNDLVYLREALSDVRRRLLLETKRVFVIGRSNGAFMGYRWACHSAGEIAGLVALSGAAPGPLDPPCLPSRPVRVLHVHGDQDREVNYYGRKGRDDGYPSARESAKLWVRLNGLKDPPRIVKERSVLLGKIQKEQWGTGERAVAFWTVFGGGHRMKWLRLEVPMFLRFLDGS